MADDLCGAVEIQGFDVVMECIRAADHDLDFHQTRVGQRWAVDLRIRPGGGGA